MKRNIAIYLNKECSLSYEKTSCNVHDPVIYDRVRQ